MTTATHAAATDIVSVCDQHRATSLVEEVQCGLTASCPIVFDRVHALARLGGMEDVLHDVMELMTTESPQVHAALKSSLDRGDATELKRAAHTLKGSVSIVGAADLARLLKRVEQSAAACDLAAASEDFVEIDRQFAELQSQLRIELQQDS